MKVRYVQKISGYIERTIDMSPKAYCKLRADLSPLKVSSPNFSVDIVTFEPASEDDKLELYDFWYKG